MRVLIHFRHYPIAMGRWFDFALRDLGHQVFSVGNYSGGKIPWGDQFNFPQYAFTPDFEIPEVEAYPIDQLLEQIDFKPDVIIQAADTTYLSGKAPCKNVVIKTDPHAVDYSQRVQFADLVFSMQDHYKSPGDEWLPYAYYPPVHFYEGEKQFREFDISLSGLQYPHRIDAMERLRNSGLKIQNTLGLLYDEYREFYHNANMSLCWSSKEDLPARFWEGLSMARLVFMNRVPDLEKLEFIDGEDYIGFSSVDELIEKAKFYRFNKSGLEKIAVSGYLKVQPHTYYKRAVQLIESIEKL